jgi:hypothetical protein
LSNLPAPLAGPRRRQLSYLSRPRNGHWRRSARHAAIARILAIVARRGLNGRLRHPRAEHAGVIRAVSSDRPRLAPAAFALATPSAWRRRTFPPAWQYCSDRAVGTRSKGYRRANLKACAFSFVLRVSQVLRCSFPRRTIAAHPRPVPILGLAPKSDKMRNLSATNRFSPVAVGVRRFPNSQDPRCLTTGSVRWPAFLCRCRG